MLCFCNSEAYFSFKYLYCYCLGDLQHSLLSLVTVLSAANCSCKSQLIPLCPTGQACHQSRLFITLTANHACCLSVALLLQSDCFSSLSLLWMDGPLSTEGLDKKQNAVEQLRSPSRKGVPSWQRLFLFQKTVPEPSVLETYLLSRLEAATFG